MVAGLIVATIITMMAVFRGELTTAITTIGCKITSAASGETGGGCGSAQATAGGPSGPAAATNIRQGGLAGGLVTTTGAGTAAGTGTPTGVGTPAGIGTPAGLGTPTGAAGTPVGAGALTGMITNAGTGTPTGAPTGSPTGAGTPGLTSGGPEGAPTKGAVPAAGGAKGAGPGAGAPAGPPAPQVIPFLDTDFFKNNPAEIPKYEVRPLRGRPFIKDRHSDPSDPKRDQEIRANDVSQGFLGDCYLLSSLAAIAETNPDIIRNAITDKGGGKYEVTFYDAAGNPVRIPVDSTFPMRKVTPGNIREPHPFAKPGDWDGHDQELWVMLIEKGYSDYKKTYGNIEGGSGNIAMDALTGKTSKYYGVTATQHYPAYPLKDGVIKMSELEDAVKKGYAITTGSLPASAAAGNPLYGGKNPIASGHEYYITAIDPVNKTVTIHNPWGWHKNILVLSYDDFQKGFADVSINKVGKR